jgi:serine/threonine protein kinase
MSSSSSSSSKNDEVWTQVEWIITSNSVAVKEMNWEIINTKRETLAEDPIKEVAAMQYLQRYVEHEEARLATSQAHQQQELIHHHGSMELETSLESTQTHVMMPIYLFSDDVNLYSITPYCTSGRLLDQIENKSRFSEPEARYWMRQILMVCFT